MTRTQWTIWLLASAGKFFEGYVVFMTGVALPLIVAEFGLSSLEKGSVGAAPLAGILFGASALGALADRFGRKPLFILEMALFAVCLLLLSLTPNLSWLLAVLFAMGLALGCDYPTAHMIISESISTSHRGRLVLSAFAFQALGALAGTAVGYVILLADADIHVWRWMYATAVLPAVIVAGARFTIPQSPHWLVDQGRVNEAVTAIRRILSRRPQYPTRVVLTAVPKIKADNGPRTSGLAALFSRQHRRAAFLASLPWFLQDLGTYGIGIFTPTILAAAIGSAETGRNLASIIHNDMLAAKGAAFIDIPLIIGMICAVLLVDRIGRMKLQIAGFVGCALGLFLATLSFSVNEGARLPLIFAGFMLFNFMTNMGPNATTYVVAGEVFPTRIRGLGAGFAASAAKIGAVATAFLFPVLLKDIGTEILLWGLVGTSLLGALATWMLRIETMGRSLESLDTEP
ncbi:MAG: MFS transporter [Deltaproteobacteria bacterium]|nr:MFS transporter [Deltaproteobacteria bacterium]